jgi:hypothetical protein
MVLVFPEPAPAKIKTGPSTVLAANLWGSFKPESEIINFSDGGEELYPTFFGQKLGMILCINLF